MVTVPLVPMIWNPSRRFTALAGLWSAGVIGILGISMPALGFFAILGIATAVWKRVIDPMMTGVLVGGAACTLLLGTSVEGSAKEIRASLLLIQLFVTLIMIFVGSVEGEILVFHNFWSVKARDRKGRVQQKVIVGQAAITTLHPGEELEGETVRTSNRLHALWAMTLMVPPAP